MELNFTAISLYNLTFRVPANVTVPNGDPISSWKEFLFIEQFSQNYE